MSFIEYRNVTKRFRTLTAVDHLSLTLQKGESVGLVGESGSGKSTAANLLLRLIPITEGQILCDGADISRLRGTALRSYRSRIQMVFQDTGSALDPKMKIASVIGEPLLNERHCSRAEVRRRVSELMENVALSAELMNRYPRELSGGQRQRAAIARALATHPELIVLDEATAGLDVSVQAQILNLLQELRRRSGPSYLMISHDLGIIQHMCDRIVILYRGCKVEEIQSENLLRVRHPYSQMLLEAIPDFKRKPSDRPIEPWTESTDVFGCAFYPRCAEATEECKITRPPFRYFDGQNGVACHHR